VVDVGMRGNNVLGAQLPLGKNFLHPLDIVAGINHHRFSSCFIPDNRTIAGKHPHGKDFMDHRRALNALRL
jgi:hypothetical protein